MKDHTGSINLLQLQNVGCCYLEPEADQSHDDLGTDLKPLVCSYHTLKLLGQAHMLEDIDYSML